MFDNAGNTRFGLLPVSVEVYEFTIRNETFVYGVGRVWNIGQPISVRHNDSSRVSEGPTR